MGTETDAAMMRFVSSLAKAGMRQFVNFLYPPACPCCGVLTGSPAGRHAAMCGTCWGNFAFIERPYCEVLGLPFSYDPGEGALCGKAIAEPPVFERLRSVAIYEGRARELVHGLKYRDRTELAPMMARWMLRAGREHIDACDCIIPLPLHRFRFISRRFNQAAELSRHMACQAERRFLPDTLVRVKNTVRQVGLSARARQENVRAAFVVRKGREGDVDGRRIVLVDDVYTTGATVSSATQALKRAGAREVTVLTFAMAISGPI